MRKIIDLGEYRRARGLPPTLIEKRARIRRWVLAAGVLVLLLWCLMTSTTEEENELTTTATPNSGHSALDLGDCISSGL